MTLSFLSSPDAFNYTANGACLRNQETLTGTSLQLANFTSYDGVQGEVQFTMESPFGPEISLSLMSMPTTILLDVPQAQNVFSARVSAAAADSSLQTLSIVVAGYVAANSMNFSLPSSALGQIFKITFAATRSARSVQMTASVYSSQTGISWSLLASVNSTVPSTSTLSRWIAIPVVRAGGALTYTCVRWLEYSPVNITCGSGLAKLNGVCISARDCAINNGGCSANQTCSASPTSAPTTTAFPTKPPSDVITTTVSTTTTTTTTTTSTTPVPNANGNFCYCKSTFQATATGCGKCLFFFFF